MPVRGEAPPLKRRPTPVAGVVRVPGKLIDFAPGHRREGVTEGAVGDGDTLATVIEYGVTGEFPYRGLYGTVSDQHGSGDGGATATH